MGRLPTESNRKNNVSMAVKLYHLFNLLPFIVKEIQRKVFMNILYLFVSHIRFYRGVDLEKPCSEDSYQFI